MEALKPVISQLQKMQAEEQKEADEQAREARHQKSIADRDAADDSGMAQTKKMRSKETHGPRPSKLDDQDCRMGNETRKRKERTKDSQLPEVPMPTRPAPSLPPSIDSQPRQETPAVPAAKKLSTRLSRFFSPLPLPRPFLNNICLDA